MLSIRIDGWCRSNISQVQDTVTASPQPDGKDLLQRCLIGSFPDCDEIPTRNDVRSWIQQTWKGVYNIQVFDMNGIQFLFEFQTRKDAQHILLGNWKRQGKQLVLDWWSPTSTAYPAHFKFDWFWIRVLVLPLHLWSESIMKKTGDKFGGWLATEEETTIKNHLRWARIKVKGPIDNISREVEIGDGDLIFSLPVWVEAPARFRRSEMVELDSRDVSPRLEKEGDKVVDSIKEMSTSHTLGLRKEGKDPVDFDMTVGAEVGSSSHVGKQFEICPYVENPKRGFISPISSGPRVLKLLGPPTRQSLCQQPKNLSPKSL